MMIGTKSDISEVLVGYIVAVGGIYNVTVIITCTSTLFV